MIIFYPIWMLAVVLVGYFIWNHLYPAVYNGVTYLFNNKKLQLDILLVVATFTGLLIWSFNY